MDGPVVRVVVTNLPYLSTTSVVWLGVFGMQMKGGRTMGNSLLPKFNLIRKTDSTPGLGDCYDQLPLAWHDSPPDVCTCDPHSLIQGSNEPLVDGKCARCGGA